MFAFHTHDAFIILINFVSFLIGTSAVPSIAMNNVVQNYINGNWTVIETNFTNSALTDNTNSTDQLVEMIDGNLTTTTTVSTTSESDVHSK